MPLGTNIGCDVEVPRPERTPFEPGDPDESATLDGGDEIPATGLVSSILSLRSPFASHTTIGTSIGGP